MFKTEVIGFKIAPARAQLLEMAQDIFTACAECGCGAYPRKPCRSTTESPALIASRRNGASGASEMVRGSPLAAAKSATDSTFSAAFKRAPGTMGGNIPCGCTKCGVPSCAGS